MTPSERDWIASAGPRGLSAADLDELPSELRCAPRCMGENLPEGCICGAATRRRWYRAGVARASAEQSRELAEARAQIGSRDAMIDAMLAQGSKATARIDALERVVCAASILVRDGEERPDIRPALVAEVRAELAALSRSESLAADAAAAGGGST